MMRTFTTPPLRWAFVAFLFLSVRPAFGAAVSGKNLVPNPGFEDTTPKGWARSWAAGAPGVFSITTEVSRTGKRSLRFENPAPNQYVLCTAPITLDIGHRYEFEAWVRTQDVKGKDSGATICLEWSDAHGKYLGGSYPPGIKGTHREWTRVHGVSGPVPETAAECHVTCYVRKTMTGVAWWDDVAVRPYFPPLLGNMTTDRYRNVTAPGTVRVRAALDFSGYDFGPDKVRANLTVAGADGKVLATIKPATITTEWLGFTVDAAAIPVGVYTLTCRATGPTRAAKGVATCSLQRVKALPVRTVTFDRLGRTLIDGKPFFPLGTYWGSISTKDLDLYAKSPFNCLMPYGRPTREQLDQAQAHNLKVIYSIKDYYAGTRWSPKFIHTEQDERPAVEKAVSQFRDHPALLAWYLNDELPLSYIDRLTAHRHWIEELDPNHPAWVVLYQFSDINGYLPSFDAVGTDPYPIPNRPARMALDWTRETVKGALHLKPVWMVPQIFNHAAYKKTPEEKSKFRAPTLAEMRSMAWQCIAGGANGLIFYSWFDLRRMDKPAKGPNGQTIRDPFDKRWKDVTAMAAEIRRFFPVLLSAETPGALPEVKAPNTVAWRLYAHNGAVYLVAVNADTTPASARFVFDRAFRTVNVELGLPEGTVLAGREVRVAFDPLEPKVIRLQP